MRRFRKETLESLGHYVYALIDPRGRSDKLKRIFYVGKGKRNRCFAHAEQELKASSFKVMPAKLKTIREIKQATGKPPAIEIVAHGLNEEEAFRLESTLIKLLPNLSNNVTGHHAENLWLDAEELNARGKPPIKAAEIKLPFLVVSLNGNRKTGLPPYPEIADSISVLRKRTLGNWPIDPQRARVSRLILGVYDSLVRTVYRVRLNRNGEAIIRVKPAAKARASRRVRFSADRDERAEEKWFGRRVIDENDVCVTKLPPRKSCLLVEPRPRKK